MIDRAAQVMVEDSLMDIVLAAQVMIEDSLIDICSLGSTGNGRGLLDR